MRGTACTPALKFQYLVSRARILSYHHFVLTLASCCMRTRPLQWARQDGLQTQELLVLLKKQIYMLALLNSADQRPCSHLWQLDTIFEPLFTSVLGSNFAGLLVPCRPNYYLGSLVELADMVGPVRACSIMHANASSGRPRREETTPTTYLILHCPRLTSAIPVYIP